MPIYEYQCKKCGHEFEQLVLEKIVRLALPATAPRYAD